MNTKEITKLVKNYHELKHDTERSLRKYVVDKTIDLDDRWKVFLESKFGDDHWTLKMPHITYKDLINELLMITGDTIGVGDLLGGAIESDVIQQHDKYKIEEYKEFCLENFINTFTFTW